VEDFSFMSLPLGGTKIIIEKLSLYRWNDVELVLTGYDHAVLLQFFYLESFVFIV